MIMEKPHKRDQDNHKNPERCCRGLSLRKILWSALVLSIVISLLDFPSSQLAESKKLKTKEKKIIKQLVKSLIIKNLSTKKNFLPLPVPFPVPIELNENPVYIKGQTKYVTVYKPAPPPSPPPSVTVKPTTVYHMPIYSPRYEYLMNPYGAMYSQNSLLYPSLSSGLSYDPYGASGYKQQYGAFNNEVGHHSAGSSMSFTDFDDEFGNYYLTGKTKGSGSHQKRPQANSYDKLHYRRSDEQTSDGYLLPIEEQESLVSDSNPSSSSSRRVKRQAGPYFESSYSYEKPCYGFPLEVNIKSRIKMDQIFPIFGNSQIKKCLKKPPMPSLLGGGSPSY